MKSKLKSAFIISLLVGFMALSLAACSSEDVKMPNIFSGSEVPQDVLNEPRLVAKPATEDLHAVPWPRLGDVPAMPKDFSPQPVLDQTVTEMHNERSENERIRNDYEGGGASSSDLTPPLFPINRR